VDQGGPGGGKFGSTTRPGEEFDAIIFGTGFELSLPFWSPTISDILDLDVLHADLYKFTFHPDLAGLAFLGLWEQTGPYFPPLELQARWITYVWSGIRPLPTQSQMNAGIAKYRGSGCRTRSKGVAAAGSSAIVCPLSAISFRLSGPDHLHDIEARISAPKRERWRRLSVPRFQAKQVAQLQDLAVARKDPEFAEFVSRITNLKL
jgi:dimethylaniline monooxygenase (N-oxide forming)